MKRFRIVVDTGFPGADHYDEVTFADSEWESMSETERENELIQSCQDTINNYISAYWEEIPDEDEDRAS